MRRGKLEGRFDVYFYLPQYINIEKALDNLYGQLKSLDKYADIICGPFGSEIKNSDYIEVGVPLIRISNITKDGGLALNDVKFISEELSQRLSATVVNENDIVISQRGTLGQCAIVTNEYSRYNISANIIGIRNIRQISPEFIRNYILSTVGQGFLLRAQSGQVQGKLTTQDIAKLPIPMCRHESKLNRIIHDALSQKQQKLTRADELLAGMDLFIAQLLELETNNNDESPYWAVQLKNCKNNRLDALSYRPLNLSTVGKKVYITHLGSIASINNNERPKGLLGNDIVPYIGLPECSLMEVKEVLTREYREVQGRNIAIEGDILFARIEPSIFNKKYIYADNLFGNKYAFLSTEFITLRAHEESIKQEYLYCALFTSYVYNQVVGKTTGSSGRRRIDRKTLEQVNIPVPSIDIQQKIINEYHSRRNKAQCLREEAEREWQAARKQFEDELLGRCGVDEQ